MRFKNYLAFALIFTLALLAALYPLALLILTVGGIYYGALAWAAWWLWNA